MWNRLSITKNCIFLALPLLTLFGTNLFPTYKLKTVSKDLIQTHYDQTYKKRRKS